MNLTVIDKSTLSANALDDVKVDFYDYLSFVLEERLFSKYNNPNKVTGVVRLAQARINNTSCTSQENLATCDMDCYLKLQSKECNTLYKSSLRALDYQEADTCALEDCEEYTLFEGEHFEKFYGEFASYSGPNLFIADFFYEDNFTEAVSRLKSNQWIDSSTKAIFLRFTVYNHWTDRYYTVEATSETPAQNMMHNSFYMHTISINKGENGISMFCIVVLALNCFVFFVKIIFELSIGLSIVANLLEMINILVILALCVSKLLQITLGSEFTEEKLASEEYIDFFEIIGIMIVTHILSIIASIFVPFRFFTLCSHFKFFNVFANMLKIYFRMLFGLLTYLVIVLVILLVWTFPIYMLLQPYCYQFRNYPTALISILMVEFWEDEDYQYMVRESPYDFLFSIIVLITITCRYVALILSISLAVNLYKAADSQENKLDQGQKVLTETVEEIKETVDKLHHYKKEELKLIEKKYGSHQNKKIVAWMLNRKKHLNEKERQNFFRKLNPKTEKCADEMDLNSRYEAEEDQKYYTSPKKGAIYMQSDEEEAMLSDNDDQSGVQTILFEYPFQLKSFLKSLFQLKPILISSYSVDKFRIVIENYVKGTNYTSLNLAGLDEIIQFLKDIGCKVPVLLYSACSLHPEIIMKLRKKYTMFTCTTDLKVVIRFCRMEPIEYFIE